MKVVFRGDRAAARNVAHTLAMVLSGRSGVAPEVRRGFLLALGFGALSDIKTAYIEKARGGTDEMGIRWPPLSPVTIANRRVGPRDRQNQDIREWDRIQRREFKRAYQRMLLSLPEGDARRRAKQVADAAARRQTGSSRVQILGSRNVEILRDTGVLFNSLSPGALTHNAYAKPHPDQIFDLTNNGVIVGTNVEYASTHQFGDQSRRIPARPFLPTNANQVPDVWWDRWLRIGVKALHTSVAMIYQQGGNP